MYKSRTDRIITGERSRTEAPPSSIGIFPKIFFLLHFCFLSTWKGESLSNNPVQGGEILSFPLLLLFFFFNFLFDNVFEDKFHLVSLWEDRIWLALYCSLTQPSPATKHRTESRVWFKGPLGRISESRSGLLPSMFSHTRNLFVFVSFNS